MKKRFIVAALAIAGAMALSGCGGGSKSSSEPAADSKTAQSEGTKKTDGGKKILTIQLGPEVETIDPALNSSVDGGNYILFAFDNLLKIDKDGNVVPGLAE